MTKPYLPLYAERSCAVCGYWRGQHIGTSANDNEMICPIGSRADFYEVVATFVPNPKRRMT